MNFQPGIFTIGFARSSDAVQDNNWTGCDVADSLAEAQKIASNKAAVGGVVAVGIWPSHHWQLGRPTCNPRFFYDNRDHSRAKICGCESLINSASSTVL